MPIGALGIHILAVSDGHLLQPLRHFLVDTDIGVPELIKRGVRDFIELAVLSPCSVKILMDQAAAVRSWEKIWGNYTILPQHSPLGLHFPLCPAGQLEGPPGVIIFPLRGLIVNIDSAPDSDPRALNIVFVLQRTQLPRPEPGQDRKAISVDIEVLCRFPAPQRCAAGEERFQAVRRHNSFLGLFGAGGDSEIFRVQTGLAPLPAPFQPIQETAPDIP